MRIICSSRRGCLTSSPTARSRACRRHCARSAPCSATPTDPFGWIDDPAAANRVIGIYWIADLLYPDTGEVELRGTVKDMYDKLYGIKLTDPQLERVIRDAGIPTSEMPMPLAGLGLNP